MALLRNLTFKIISRLDRSTNVITDLMTDPGRSSVKLKGRSLKATTERDLADDMKIITRSYIDRKWMLDDLKGLKCSKICSTEPQGNDGITIAVAEEQQAEEQPPGSEIRVKQQQCKKEMEQSIRPQAGDSGQGWNRRPQADGLEAGEPMHKTPDGSEAGQIKVGSLRRRSRSVTMGPFIGREGHWGPEKVASYSWSRLARTQF
ncbi:unnamed protein product [Pleuronectes platessa]|uniref:Uncharacterized protein n=1 Tax=Pleuronectes platessa TaxID=8262 RepID=A0A9N7Z1F5_PLEPL|nr:unnamed protein product [Pleuronectes platessa]